MRKVILFAIVVCVVLLMACAGKSTHIVQLATGQSPEKVDRSVGAFKHWGRGGADYKGFGLSFGSDFARFALEFTQGGYEIEKSTIGVDLMEIPVAEIEVRKKVTEYIVMPSLTFLMYQYILNPDWRKEMQLSAELRLGAGYAFHTFLTNSRYSLNGDELMELPTKIKTEDRISGVGMINLDLWIIHLGFSFIGSRENYRSLFETGVIW